MALTQISFKVEGEKKMEVLKALKAFRHQRVTDQTYILDSEIATDKIYQYFRGYIDDNDTLFVATISPPLHIHARSDIVDWIVQKS